METRELKIQKQARFSKKRSWWSYRGEAAMCCPRVGLALCVLLRSSLWVVVRGGSVCGLVDSCGCWREKQYESSLGDNVIY